MYVPRGRLQQATDSLPRKPPASATSRTETSHNFPKVENARRGSTSSRHERPSFHSTSRYAYYYLQKVYAFFTGCPGDLPCPLSAVSGKCSTGAKTSKQRGRLGRSLSRTRARPQHGSPKRPVFERNLRGVGAGGGGCVVLFGAYPSFSASASWFLAREFGANFGEDAKTSPRA